MTDSHTPSEQPSPEQPSPRSSERMGDVRRGRDSQSSQNSSHSSHSQRGAQDVQRSEQTDAGGLEAFEAFLRGVETNRFAPGTQAAEADGRRLAHAIMARVHGDERAASERETADRLAAATAPGGRRHRIMRILAVSIGLHLLLLGFVTWKVNEPTKDSPKTSLSAAWEEPLRSMPNTDPLASLEDLAMRDPEAIDRLPESIFALETDREPTPSEVSELLAEGAEMGPRFTYPEGMGWAMGRRSNSLLKRRRLVSLGYNPNETLEAVGRGLTWLASKQKADGAWGEGKAAMGHTATALLPFLSEGSNSLGARVEAHSQVVDEGVTWLRGLLFEDHVRDGRRLREGVFQGVSAREAGAVLVALSEDYMLTFGRLEVRDARRRSLEIAALTSHVRTANSPSAEVATLASSEVWRPWALEAAERTGVILRTSSERQAAEAVRVALVNEGLGAAAGRTAEKLPADRALAQGAALLATERGAEKPKFATWQRATTSELLERLLPSGRARGATGEEATRSTALLLLALQVGYRAY